MDRTLRAILSAAADDLTALVAAVVIARLRAAVEVETVKEA